MLSEESYKALLKYEAGEIRSAEPLSEREEYLKFSGFIEEYWPSTDARDSDGYPLTDPVRRIALKGADALAEFKKAGKQESKAERQQRFQNKVSVAAVLVPTVTFLIGLVVEHFAGIAGIIIGFLS